MRFPLVPIRRHALRFRNAAIAVAAAAASASPLSAQSDSAAAMIGGSYYGPRIGLTWLDAAVLKKASDNGINTASFILQFGWQWSNAS